MKYIVATRRLSRIKMLRKANIVTRVTKLGKIPRNWQSSSNKILHCWKMEMIFEIFA